MRPHLPYEVSLTFCQRPIGREFHLRESQDRKPQLRSPNLENDVEGDFEEGVADEEQGKTGQVFVAGHLEVGGETFDFGIAD